MKIAFYSPHLSLGGTEITMYDFADYNEKILGNESIIIYNKDNPLTHKSVIEKFKVRFNKVYCLEGPDYNWSWKSDVTVPLLDSVIEKEHCDGLYMQKFGNNDGVVSKKCKTYILCAAGVCEPHGDVYAYVSEWLSKQACGGKYPAVPSMITPLPSTEETFRKELNIPENAMVFGRHGGTYGWDIPWTNEVIKHVVENHNIYFIFQNTPIPFTHEKVKHIEPSADLQIKSKFINTCNGMIHSRSIGESFGCACGEFSSMNKRIITFSNCSDRNHITLLGEKGLYYTSPEELYNHLVNFTYEPEKDWNGYKDYNPERIMGIFNEVFLK